MSIFDNEEYYGHGGFGENPYGQNGFYGGEGPFEGGSYPYGQGGYYGEGYGQRGYPYGQGSYGQGSYGEGFGQGYDPYGQMPPGENGIDSEGAYYDRIKDRLPNPENSSYCEMSVVYPFIDRHLKTSEWTRQADNSFLFVINGKNNIVNIEDGEVIATRWDGAQMYIGSYMDLERFLLEGQ